MEEFFSQTIASKYNYWCYIALMMIGLYAMVGKRNMIKKIVGMNIFQTAIILFYVSLGVKRDATLPILEHHGHEGGDAGGHAAAQGAHDTLHAVPGATPDAVPDAVSGAAHATGPEALDHAAGAADAAHHVAINAADYINPLPHVLMLTAIVVSVATLGVALALALRVHRRYGTLDETEILESLRQ